MLPVAKLLRLFFLLQCISHISHGTSLGEYFRPEKMVGLILVVGETEPIRLSTRGANPCAFKNSDTYFSDAPYSHIYFVYSDLNEYLKVAFSHALEENDLVDIVFLVDGDLKEHLESSGVTRSKKFR